MVFIEGLSSVRAITAHVRLRGSRVCVVWWVVTPGPPGVILTEGDN